MKLTKPKIYSAIGIVAITLVIVYRLFFYGIETTDNAQVGGHVAVLSTKVSGIVTDVMVDENQKVKKGEVLVRLDQRDFVNARDQLASELVSTEARFTQSRKNFSRAQNLFEHKAIPSQEMEAAQSQFDDLKAKVDSIRTQLKESELNLEFSEIKAPEDGTIGKKSVEPGMVVSSTQPLMSFVSSRAKWITANYKETQLRRMRVGDHAKLSIDSIEGKEFEGEIESLSPGTGATFALIPPENATGNFTKIVQRLPVRIKLSIESTHGFEDRIVPGLSADVKVFLK